MGAWIAWCRRHQGLNISALIIEMSDLMTRDMELQLAVGKIQDFVEDDVNGQLVRLGNTRLLLLPPTFDSARVK